MQRIRMAWICLYMLIFFFFISVTDSNLAFLPIHKQKIFNFREPKRSLCVNCYIQIFIAVIITLKCPTLYKIIQKIYRHNFF